MLRDLRRADGPPFLALMDRGFPEESALLGNRPEEFEKIFRRIFRWDTRLLLGLMGLFGRPIVRALVVEADGHVVATTLITFPPGSAYISNVTVDPDHRRRGYARAMLEEARRTARRRKLRFLVLDVLEHNTGARALYDSLGYQPLRARVQLVQDATAKLSTARPSSSSIRPMRRSDIPTLVEIARRQSPSAVEKVLPTGPDRFLASGVANRMLASEEASWVVDRGQGPEAHVAATVSEAMEAAHLTAPTLSDSVDDRLAIELVSTAGAWCATRRSPRILSMVAVDNPRGRAALEATGFHDAVSLWTLYRSVD
ncbi:MAG TPA: GNAT family N-acetyltransferase [Thermoplasmata archaeon]|nr:GNAT family N-acetyltransferase [Thermoplasmata archaeon]